MLRFEYMHMYYFVSELLYGVDRKVVHIVSTVRSIYIHY